MKDLIENSEFGDFCEKMWQKWLSQGAKAFSDQVDGDSFQLDFLPEPYLTFSKKGDVLDFLYVLTTNPGGAIPIQSHDYLLQGKSIISPQVSYNMISRVFADFYANDFEINLNAKRRVEKILMLSKMLGKKGVVQIESCPFHSPSFPSKDRFIKETQKNKFFQEYTEKLKLFLKDKSVLIVSATSSQTSLSLDNISNSTWLKWQADLVSFNMQTAIFNKIVEKNGKTTSGLAVDSSKGCTKGIFLTMGSNNLPSVDGLKIIAENMVLINSTRFF